MAKTIKQLKKEENHYLKVGKSNYKKARKIHYKILDKIRKEIEEEGYTVMNTPNGTVVVPNYENKKVKKN